MMTLRLLDNELILKKISLTGENAYLKMIKDIIEVKVFKIWFYIIFLHTAVYWLNFLNPEYLDIKI